MAFHPDYPRTRLYIEQPLTQGGQVALQDKQHHYLAHVLRAKAGDAVALFNGGDGEWLGQVENIGKKEISVVLIKQLRQPQSRSSDITLAFAPIKVMENMVQKATELGAAKFQPVITQHTMVKRLNLERLRDHAIEAAEQCERLEVPEILAPVTFSEFLAQQKETLLYGDESGQAEPIADAITELKKKSLTILTGPEGGFAQEELQALRAEPYAVGASLGPRILRADTAALAMLAILQSARDDWQGRPAFRSAP